MSRKKKILVIFLTIVVLLMLFATWYQYTYSMDEAVSFEVNSPENTHKVLIATQGSEFKNKITKNVVNKYKEDSVYIRVIDVSKLTDISPKNYDAILIMHTWESWKPPASVEVFFHQEHIPMEAIVVLTTSGEGSYKMEGIDAITGESDIDDVPLHTDTIIRKIDKLLYNQPTKSHTQ